LPKRRVAPSRADRLYASVNTVRTQPATLYRKLGVTNRDGALQPIHELGID
jgi:DNA-binding CsgD family transcriptional regulator